MRRSRTSRGFTLVEALVVVAIVAVLASAIITALRPARDAARGAACAANLRSIFLVCRQHADQNNGFGPAVGQPYGSVPNWALQVQVSLGNTGAGPGEIYRERSVLVCPASPPPTDSPMTRTYAMNGTGHNRAAWNADPDSYDLALAPGARPVAIRFDRVARPSLAPLALDSARNAQTPPLPPDRTASVIDFRPDAGHLPERLGLVHGKGKNARLNAAAFDGSVSPAGSPAPAWAEPLP